MDTQLELRLTEIFFSLQGETSRTGLPTVFIRLSGCPLRCGWCDTSYSFTGGETWKIADILDTVAGYGTQYVTVTGGERLLTEMDIEIEAGHPASTEPSQVALADG